MKKAIKKSVGTKKQFTQLQKEVEQKFGQKIESKSSSIALSENILNETGTFLSYNTIRRFFGLVETTSQISLSSLDTFAAYCGYANFSVFANQKPDIDKQELKFKLLEFLKNDQFNINTIKWLCEKYNGFLEAYHFLEQCLIIAQYQNNRKFFKEFYRLPHMFNLKAFNKTAIFNIANLYAHLINNFDENIKKEILVNIALLPNARQFYFEYFVDLNNINGYYGDALEYYIKDNRKQESRIFYHELKIFQSFLNKDKNGINYNYQELCNHYPKEDSQLHPFLQGRYFASKAFLSQKLSDQVFDLINKKIEAIAKKSTLNAQLFIIPILQALQFTANAEKMILIFNKNAKYIIWNDFLTDNAVNHIRIYFAQSAILVGNRELAENYLAHIKPDQFAPFESKLQSISYRIMLCYYYSLLKDYNNFEENIRVIQSIGKNANFEEFKNYIFVP